MRTSLAFAGIDVDDKSFHVSIVDQNAEILCEFKVSPSATALCKILNERNFKPEHIKLCYEASYIGFSICRQLLKQGKKNAENKL